MSDLDIRLEVRSWTAAVTCGASPPSHHARRPKSPPSQTPYSRPPQAPAPGCQGEFEVEPES